MDNDKKLPDALGGQQLKGRRPLGRHLQQIQPCTCQSHCQRPERLRLRHTSCWVFVELVFLNELGSRVSSGLRWTFLGELAFIDPHGNFCLKQDYLIWSYQYFSQVRRCSWQEKRPENVLGLLPACHEIMQTFPYMVMCHLKNIFVLF